MTSNFTVQISELQKLHARATEVLEGYDTQLESIRKEADQVGSHWKGEAKSAFDQDWSEFLTGAQTSKKALEILVEGF